MNEFYSALPPSTCAVSVVIPLYNAEKFIGACLTSLLAQTFQNFEVIVVNDCSTDNSVAIVESYREKFGGRLTLSHMKKNSGSPAEPTNKGIAYATGKYVVYVDNDDLLLNNALEKLYTTAEKFQADFVHMDRHLSFKVGTEEPFPKNENLFVVGGNISAEPVIETNDIAERIRKFSVGQFGGVAGWMNFLRRDLLIENDITLKRMPSAQDIVWLVQLICCAKKIVHIFEPLYIYRVHSSSITRKNRSDESRTNFWLEVGIKSLTAMDEFLRGQKFFQDNPQCRWQVLNYFEYGHSGGILSQGFVNSPPYEFCKTFTDRLVEDLGGYGELLAYLYITSNLRQAKCVLLNQRLQHLERQMKK